MNIKAFIDSLSFMGIGMASIIIVIGVLIVSVLLLNLFTSKRVKTVSKILLVFSLLMVLIGISILNM
jgi:hypothetical protein